MCIICRPVCVAVYYVWMWAYHVSVCDVRVGCNTRTCTPQLEQYRVKGLVELAPQSGPQPSPLARPPPGPVHPVLPSAAVFAAVPPPHKKRKRNNNLLIVTKPKSAETTVPAPAQNTTNRSQHSNNPKPFTTAQEKLRHIINTGDAWAWKLNSCHLDTFCLLELVALSWLEFHYALDSRDSLTTNAKLLHTLLLAADTDSTERDNFWKNNLSHDSPYGSTEDVLSHVEWLTRVARTSRRGGARRSNAEINTIRDRYVTYLMSVDCTGTCELLPSLCSDPYLNVGTGWFGTPESFRNSEHIPYKDMQDAINRTLLQQSRDATQCPYTNDPFCHHINRLDPSVMHLPRILVVGTPEGTTLTYDENLSIGGVEYRLVGVAFRRPPFNLDNGTKTVGHYACNFRLPDPVAKWYGYNDLGHHNNSKNPRVFGVSSPRDSPVFGASPRAFYYVRVSPTSDDETDMTAASGKYPIATAKMHRVQIL